MHDRKKEVRLTLCSDGRDFGTVDNCTFNIPDITQLATHAKDVLLTVERLHVESSVTDNDETFVLMLESHPLSHQYDSIEKTSANIIALTGNNQSAGVYRSLAGMPLKNIPVANFLGSQLRLRLTTMKVKGNVASYYPPIVVSASGDDTSVTRKWYAVLKLTFCDCHG